MFTEVIIPQKTSVVLEVPQEMVGHRVRVTFDDIGVNRPGNRPRTVAEALEQFSLPRLDTRGWRFNRDEANER